MQMTPNPLIKNSFASPVKEADTSAEKGSDLQPYYDQSAKSGPRQFCTLSSNKKTLRMVRDTSQHSTNMSSAIKSIPIQKIDISQFSG